MKTIQEGNAHNSGFDTDHSGKSAELQGLHLYVSDSFLLSLPQEIHFVSLCVFADGSIEAPLALIEVITAHSLGDSAILVH